MSEAQEDITELQSSVATIESTLTNVQTDIADSVRLAAGGPILWGTAALKAGTSLPLLAAPGVGKTIIPWGLIAVMDYGGTNAFTNNPGWQFTYASGETVAITTGAVGFWTGTNDRVFFEVGFENTSMNYANMTNSAIELDLGAAVTGNAGNNNVVYVQFYYTIMDLT